jgi:hypothetical protein
MPARHESSRFARETRAFHKWLHGAHSKLRVAPLAITATRKAQKRTAANALLRFSSSAVHATGRLLHSQAPCPKPPWSSSRKPS